MARWTLAISLFLVAALSAPCCTPALAASPEAIDAAVEKPASLSAPAQGADEAPAQLAAGEASAGQPGQAAGCLGEGALCNTLNDHCCPGYYCFGGLVPTCFRKP